MSDNPLLHNCYILDDSGNVRKPRTVTEFIDFTEGDFRKRIVRREDLGDKADWDRLGGARVWISTVFLTMDHGFSVLQGENYRPVLWETMVFGLPEEFMDRYTSREEALQGHERIAAEVMELYDLKGRQESAID